jgi:hypothetical protein
VCDRPEHRHCCGIRQHHVARHADQREWREAEQIAEEHVQRMPAAGLEDVQAIDVVMQRVDGPEPRGAVHPAVAPVVEPVGHENQ